MTTYEADRDVEATVRQNEARRYEAMIKGDIGALDSLLSERLVYGHSNGIRTDKAGYLDGVRRAVVTYEIIDSTVDAVTVAGGTAIIAGSMKASILFGDERRSLHNLTLTVWLEEESGWRLAALQATPPAILNTTDLARPAAASGLETQS